MPEAKIRGGTHRQEIERLRREKQAIIDAAEQFAARMEFALETMQVAFDKLREAINKAKAEGK